MDLTVEYMRNQGTLGYAHEGEISDFVILAHGTEGSELTYIPIQVYELDAIMDFWEKTGEIRIPRLNYVTGEIEHDIFHPTNVKIFTYTKNYYRRNHPPQIEVSKSKTISALFEELRGKY